MLDPDALDGINLDAADSACGLPVATQIERLRVALAAKGPGAPAVELTDLMDLSDLDRTVALDAMCAAEPSPIVVLEGRLVCTGSVDIPAVLGVLGW
jgi:hypothetical protein